MWSESRKKGKQRKGNEGRDRVQIIRRHATHAALQDAYTVTPTMVVQCQHPQWSYKKWLLHNRPVHEQKQPQTVGKSDMQMTELVTQTDRQTVRQVA